MCRVRKSRSPMIEKLRFRSCQSQGREVRAGIQQVVVATGMFREAGPGRRTPNTGQFQSPGMQGSTNRLAARNGNLKIACYTQRLRGGELMSFVRSIGRWALTGLVINCMIGSGIFGIPGELNRLLGRASPVAMVLAALATALVILPTMEVASQFSEPGGAYVYARTAFGRFAGLQVGWFSLLSMVAADAANASLFVIYLAGFFPAAGQSWPRNLLMAALIAIPAWVNYRGANSGASLS